MPKLVLRYGSAVLFTALLAVAATSNLGCAKLRETYYVGVYHKESGALQFYRFRLRGDSYLSKTKFVSGWYPAAGVDALVGESMDDILKPSSPTPRRTEVVPTVDGEVAVTRTKETDTLIYWVAGPEGRKPKSDGEQRLAIVMSGDIKAFTDAIQQLAETEAVKARVTAHAKRQEQKDAANTEMIKKLVEDRLKRP